MRIKHKYNIFINYLCNLQFIICVLKKLLVYLLLIYKNVYNLYCISKHFLNTV